MELVIDYVIGIDFGHGETSAAICPLQWNEHNVALLDKPTDIDDHGINVFPSAIRVLNNGDVKIGGYKKISLDVETGGSGKINIHLQVDGKKYFYNNTTGTYVGENGAKLPNSIAKNSKIQQATDKALQYARKIQD